MRSSGQNLPVPGALTSRTPFLWINPALSLARPELDRIADAHSLSDCNIDKADALLRRWQGALAIIFPELAASSGVIESELQFLSKDDVAAVADAPIDGASWLKCDHLLPIAGSIKARGGIYEVLLHAESVASANGLFSPGDDPEILTETAARNIFSQHLIGVGSTGNLGISVGVMASALGFRAVVHMSHDAKDWKKERLRERGVEVVEHAGDYAAAVAAGRADLKADPRGHFVDDEDSLDLLLGYAVAARRLAGQLTAAGVTINAHKPLFVYLPCGVGGAPGGITFGLKQVFGDAVHCFFGEPTSSPAMLIRMVSDEPLSVYDLGLDNRTEADGLAVAQASELVYRLVGNLISGVYTVDDAALCPALYALEVRTGLRIEPSAATTFVGPRMFASAVGQAYLASAAADQASITHLFWTTGGSFVPETEYQRFWERGREQSRQVTARRGMDD